MMMRQVTLINWRYIGDAIPAFVTLLFMPFSYSVAYGLIAGLLTYAVLNGMIWITRIVSMGYIIPDDEEYKEYWTWKPSGTLPWFIRAIQDPKSVFHGGDVDHNIREIAHSEHSSFEDMKDREYVGTPPAEKNVSNVHVDENKVPYSPRPTYDPNTGSRVY
jgi:AGZA family xanthine/uracil permease-like MFS transporter